jgi:predicted methyltransferase
MKKILSLLTALGLCLTVQGFTADPVADAIGKPGRLETDLQRDTRSRPDIVLPLLQLQPGDRVADIWAGGGYYSELIATIVGDEGEVLVVNNLAYGKYVDKALTERQEGRNLGNFTMHTREVEDLDLGQDTLDAALIILSYHDTYHVDEPNGWRAINAADFMGQIHRALKTGGRFLVVDHYAASGSGNAAAQELHRIDIDFVIDDISSRGFKLVAESDILRNPLDNYAITVFDPTVRGKTDRFVLVFEKL